MSEYQHYEFQALDRPFTSEQMSELRALSTRAVITSNSFTNTYHYGDFRGDPRKLMESYFDAHVYVSNFGTVTFMLRLPSGVLPDDTLTLYSVGGSLDCWATKGHTILEWRRDEESPEGLAGGEGWMAQLLPIRDELVRGDYRSLYIGWLSSIAGESAEEDDESDDGEDEEDDNDDDGTSRREPLVPPGLGSLTGSQAALAEFLGVDIDLIAAAAVASPEISAKDSLDRKGDQEIDLWIAQLPESEIRTILARIMRGEGLRIQAELQSRYYRSRRESAQNAPTGSGRDRRTADDLLAQAAKIARERKQRDLEEKKRKRHAHLARLVPRFPELWATVGSLAEEKSASSYDKACSLLVDMRDAYAQAGRRPDFDAEFARFMGRHSHRPALVRRLREVRLAS